MTGGSPSGFRWFRLALGGALAVVLIIAVVRGWESAEHVVLQSAWVLLVAVLMVAGGLLAGARGWAALVGEKTGSRAAFSAFIAAQPAKYLPAGFLAQGAAQVGLSVSPQSAVGKTSTAYVVFALVQFAAGALVGSGTAVFGHQVPSAYRYVPAIGVAGLALLHRDWMASGLGRAAALIGKTVRRDLIPSQDAILRAFGWVLVPIVLSGTAFALVLHGGIYRVPETVTAFAAAWTLGFAAIPTPSGLGVREIVLVALMPDVSSAAIIAASVIHRLATAGAELLLFVAVWKLAFSSAKE